MPDVCFGLIQQQLLNGKSIGFLPHKVREPNDDERERFGRKADTIIEEWMLLEYACVYLPAQQNAVVEVVSKGLPEEVAKALGIVTKELRLAESAMSFTRWGEIEKAVADRLGQIDFPQLARRLTADAIAIIRGRLE